MNNSIPQIIHYDTVDSTMDKAKALISDGKIVTDTIISADQQIKGRGRRGQHWISPIGNLYISLVVHNFLPKANIGQAAFIAGVALHQSIVEQLSKSYSVSCKWPNDILVDGKKIGGVLIETKNSHIIIGVGVNIKSYPATETRIPTTSLAECNQTTVVPEKFIANFYNQFCTWRKCWLDQGFEPIRQHWLSHAHGLGQPVSVCCKNSTNRITGIFQSLDFTGAFVLKTPSSMQKISATDGWSVNPDI